jgi:hypothetical protein
VAVVDVGVGVGFFSIEGEEVSLGEVLASCEEGAAAGDDDVAVVGVAVVGFFSADGV